MLTLSHYRNECAALCTALLAAILYVYVVRRLYPKRRRGDDEGSGRLAHQRLSRRRGLATASLTV